MVNMVALGVVLGHPNSPCRIQGLLKPPTQQTSSIVLLRPQVYFQCRDGGTRMLSKLATSLWGPDCSSGSQTRAQTCGWWEEHLYSGLWRHTPEGLTPGSQAAPFWPGDQVRHIGRLLADFRPSHSKVCHFRSGSHRLIQSELGGSWGPSHSPAQHSL